MLQQFFSIAFIRIHILYHASQGPIFGLAIIEELGRHGYRISPGTLYPLLHRMEKEGFMRSKRVKSDGRIRRMYRITSKGLHALEEAKRKVRELFREIIDAEPCKGK